MLMRATSDELRAKGARLLELAERRKELPVQRELMVELGRSGRLAAVRPLARAWACSAQVGRPKKRWFSFGSPGSDEEVKTADRALAALGELWAEAAPTQYNQLDQELRRGAPWSPVASEAWWQLSPRATLASLPDAPDLQAMGVGLLCCHPSGYMREAAVRVLVAGPLEFSLPFLLVRANDWVGQVRALAHARLLKLRETDVDQLAPLLELVLRLAAQGRRGPEVIEHLLRLLRTPRGLAAVQRCWTSRPPSLRRAAVRFSWDESSDRGPVLEAAVGSKDAALRFWAVERLAESKDPSAGKTLRSLTRDPIPMVATSALNALEGALEPDDRDLLEELRCVPSPGLQHAARFMLKKEFGETSHREVYLRLLEADDERSHRAAAIGLAATGTPEDREALLSTRLGARSKVRQQLLGAAAALDFTGTRGALFEDLGHELHGVSVNARRLLADHILFTDAATISELLGDAKPHVRKNALVLAARLSHWEAVPLILRAMRDPNEDVSATAAQFLDAWFWQQFRTTYMAPTPSDTQAQAVRNEMATCGSLLDEAATKNLTRALEGEWSP